MNRIKIMWFEYSVNNTAKETVGVEIKNIVKTTLKWHIFMHNSFQNNI